jgi:hypothetical protein
MTIRDEDRRDASGPSSPREFRAQRLPSLVVACIDKRQPAVAKIDDRRATNPSFTMRAKPPISRPPGISPLPDAWP